MVPSSYRQRPRRLATGPGLGIGRVIARKILEPGASVCFTGRTAVCLAGTAEGFPAERIVVCEAGDRIVKAGCNAIQASAETFGKLDVSTVPRARRQWHRCVCCGPGRGALSRVAAPEGVVRATFFPASRARAAAPRPLLRSMTPQLPRSGGETVSRQPETRERRIGADVKPHLVSGSGSLA
jgi:hypothetical protein